VTTYRIVGYVRVSTDEQGASGLGLDAQRAAIEAVGIARGWQIVEIVVDAGISGAISFGSRPAGAEALVLVESGQADAIVAAKLDRLSRSVSRFADLVEQARADRWALVALDVDVDMTTASGELVANVMAVVAQWERRAIGERTRAALAAKRAQGVTLGRPKLIEPKLEARIIAARQGGSTLQAIADDLNAVGITTPTGRRWSPALVRKITVRNGCSGRGPTIAYGHSTEPPLRANRSTTGRR
jgi:DNA invertase Pin-like site-specific DNA recombinase